MPQSLSRRLWIGRVFTRVSWLGAVAVNVSVTVSLLLLDANATVAAIVYLVFVVWFATLAGFAISIYLAITSSLLFDFYFLAPRHSLALSGFQSWFSMIAFVASCAVVARVAEQSRMQRRKAEQRREDVECLNSLSQEMMLHGDARELIRDIPRLVEQIFGVDAVLLYVGEDDQTYSSIPGGTSTGNTIAAENLLLESATSREPVKVEYARADLVFGMKRVGTLAWTPDKLSREVATSVAAQLAIAITRAHAIEASGRLEAARAADRLRSALIDSLTHELRTPLTAIRAAATTLVDGRGLDEETRTELAAILDEESSRLDDLIGEAMEMAEIDSDGIRVQPRAVQIGPFLEDAVEQLHTQLKSHRVTIEVDQPDVPLIFDPHLIGRVVHHLLENAARYTPANSRILLRSQRLLERTEFSVEDDGPGIEIHEQPMIFEKFYRGKHKKILSKGSGMGLAICRSMVIAHGGAIRVESAPGKGAKFSFWLPVAGRKADAADSLRAEKLV